VDDAVRRIADGRPGPVAGRATRQQGGAPVDRRPQLAPLPGGTKSLQVWVHGDGDDHMLWAVVRGDRGTVHGMLLTRDIHWTGWRHVRAHLRMTPSQRMDPLFYGGERLAYLLDLCVINPNSHDEAKRTVALARPVATVVSW
jgi:hypothetical protein